MEPNTNQAQPAIVSPKQAQELTESTKSVIAGADRVLKALEKMQSSPEYIKVSETDAKYPGYMNLYYGLKEAKARQE